MTIMREELRKLLRAARFDGRDVDQLTDDVLKLLGVEESAKPAAKPRRTRKPKAA